MALPGFESLEELSLCRCGIDRLPEITTDHAPLFSLKISDNALTTIPDSFGKLSKLKELDLSRNEFQTFPSALSTLTRLRELELSSNCIKDLPSSCNNLVALEELNLQYNDLRTLPDHMDGLIRLKKIDLSRQGGTKNGSLRVSSIPADLLTRLPEKDLLLDWSIVKKRKLEAVRYALSCKKSL
jgi:Leucine-rich repeat (LRR) protein